jgi:anaerobic ribonucleoside-triphosphate reductase
MSKENSKNSTESKEFVAETEKELKEAFLSKYKYLQSEYTEKDLFLYWDALEKMKDDSHRETKDVLNMVTVPVIRVSDNIPIGLLVFKFKSTGPDEELKITKSRLVFISIN